MEVVLFCAYGWVCVSHVCTGVKQAFMFKQSTAIIKFPTVCEYTQIYFYIFCVFIKAPHSEMYCILSYVASFAAWWQCWAISKQYKNVYCTYFSITPCQKTSGQTGLRHVLTLFGLTLYVVIFACYVHFALMFLLKYQTILIQITAKLVDCVIVQAAYND